MTDRLSTVTSTVDTVTVTVTVTGNGNGPVLAARQVTVTPSAVPTYLSQQCTRPGVYGAACSCLGIPQTTTTAPTPTTTVSVTATTTETVTAAPTCTGGSCGNYRITGCGDDDPATVCVCGLDAENQPVCFLDRPCSEGQSCSASSDCPAGERCVVQSCCNDGAGICSLETALDACSGDGIGPLRSNEAPSWLQSGSSASGAGSDAGSGTDSGSGSG